MDRYALRYIISLILIVMIIILLIVGVVRIFFSSGPRTTPPPAPTTPVKKTITDYVDSGEVTYTLDGRVNGEDQHRSIRITVDHNKRQLDILAGYNEEVLNHYEQNNSEQAYDVFLRSLNTSGFLLKRKDTKAPDDERGQCPLGTRSIYELVDTDTGDSVSRLWTSSCGASVGTLGGQAGTLQSLFQAQITNYNTLTNNVTL